MTVVIYYYQFCFQRATRENTFYSNWCHPLKIKVIIMMMMIAVGFLKTGQSNSLSKFAAVAFVLLYLMNQERYLFDTRLRFCRLQEKKRFIANVKFLSDNIRVIGNINPLNQTAVKKPSNAGFKTQ